MPFGVSSPMAPVTRLATLTLMAVFALSHTVMGCCCAAPDPEPSAKTCCVPAGQDASDEHRQGDQQCPDCHCTPSMAGLPDDRPNLPPQAGHPIDSPTLAPATLLPPDRAPRTMPVPPAAITLHVPPCSREFTCRFLI